MNRKPIIFILSIVAIFIVVILTASYFYFANTTTNETTIVESEDTQLINKVIEIEKNLVLTQTRNITFGEFKDKATTSVHSNYKDSYFSELEKIYNEKGNLVASSKTPVLQYISKVYTGNDGGIKSIYIKIPTADTTSQWAKLYIFKQENNEWKIFSVTNYILAISKNEPKKIIEKFTNYNDAPIEYESIKILG
jgi:dolichyl-phosphate-mannose--protein O-mannosyl transferase